MGRPDTIATAPPNASRNAINSEGKESGTDDGLRCRRDIDDAAVEVEKQCPIRARLGQSSWSSRQPLTQDPASRGLAILDVLTRRSRPVSARATGMQRSGHAAAGSSFEARSRRLESLEERRTGAAGEIRTPDPCITNALLYRLSYCGPVPCGTIVKARRVVKAPVTRAGPGPSRKSGSPGGGALRTADASAGASESSSDGAAASSRGRALDSARGSVRHSMESNAPQRSQTMDQAGLAVAHRVQSQPGSGGASLACWRRWRTASPSPVSASSRRASRR